MIDEVQRLQRFKAAVLDEAEARVQEILEEARAESESISADADSRAEKELRDRREKLDADCERELMHRVSTAKLTSQRDILVYREQLADKVFENVLAKLREFRESGEYKTWLLKSVSAVCEKYPGEKAVAAVSPKDNRFKSELEALGAEIEEDPSIMLGGAGVSLPGRGIMFDCTFDSLVERERADFTRTADLKIKDQE